MPGRATRFMSTSGTPTLTPPEALPDFSDLSALPRDGDGPVFREPWEAQAFAMTLALHKEGRFTWGEWTEALSAEIAAARARGEPDRGDTYYRHWLAALENLVGSKGLVGDGELAGRRAALDTPAGE